LAVLVNYACHPTTLAWENTLISPDFVGALREVVEAETLAACVFLQGASGDLGPREGFVGGPEVADRNGRQLGFAVLSGLMALPPPASRFTYTGPVVSGATIGTWRHEPLGGTELASLARWHIQRGTVDLPYRADLPTVEATAVELQTWQAREGQAHAAGSEQEARDCRATVSLVPGRAAAALPRHAPPGPDADKRLAVQLPAHAGCLWQGHLPGVHRRPGGWQRGNAVGGRLSKDSGFDGIEPRNER
jgi:hypothetical protein